MESGLDRERLFLIGYSLMLIAFFVTIFCLNWATLSLFGVGSVAVLWSIWLETRGD